MFTILGAGGAIGNELVKELTPRNEAIRLVSRNPTLVPGVIVTSQHVDARQGGLSPHLACYAPMVFVPGRTI
jgi:uncharacterized protein YbjT (DUF2867 family)